jgi:hypothetical protein
MMFWFGLVLTLSLRFDTLKREQPTGADARAVTGELDGVGAMRHFVSVMEPEKKALIARSLPQAAPKVIRLKPSVTDYATFVATTSKVMGTTGAAAQKTKPNKLVLSLMNLDS